VCGSCGLLASGKATLTSHLARLADPEGPRLAAASIDDVYSPGDALGRSVTGNSWQAPRALPGSHDVQLLLEALAYWQA